MKFPLGVKELMSFGPNSLVNSPVKSNLLGGFKIKDEEVYMDLCDEV